MFDQHAVFENSDLRVVAGGLRRRVTTVVTVGVVGHGRRDSRALADDHHTVDGFAPGQEFGFAQDRRPPAARIASVPTSLSFGLEPGGPRDALDFVAPSRLVARFALVNDRVGRIIRGSGVVAITALATTATPTPTVGRAAIGGVVLVIRLRRVGVGIGLRLLRLLGIRLGRGIRGRCLVSALLALVVFALGPGLLRPAPLAFAALDVRLVRRVGVVRGGFVVGRVC